MLYLLIGCDISSFAHQWVCECSLLDLDRLKRNLEGLVAIHQYWRIGGATLSLHR